MIWIRSILYAWILLESASFFILVTKDTIKESDSLSLYEASKVAIDSQLNAYKNIIAGSSYFSTSVYDPIAGYWFPDNTKLKVVNKSFISNSIEDPRSITFPDKPKDLYRIILLGGSSAAGVPGLGKNTISSKLEVKINKMFQQEGLIDDSQYIQVLNFGQIAGYSGNNLSRFTQYLIHLEPDAVILYTGYNDSIYGINNQNGVSFINWNPVFLSEYLHIRELILPRTIIFPFSTEVINRAIGFLKRRGFLSPYHKEYYTNYREYNFNNPLPGMVTDYVRSKSESSEPSILAKNMIMFANIASGANIKLVSMLQPVANSVSEKSKLIFERYKKDWQLLNSIYKKNKNIIFVDATNSFADENNEKHFFLNDGFHLTPEGNSEIADSFFNSLVSIWDRN